ncbi:MAG: TIGR01212 family radical SAM protein [Clostridia bacterium]|nr:TIGR01212 family radical SAM protein [Clostridia bacterium]
MSQKDVNPYPFSDTNKRYQTFDYYTRKTFGGKCARIPLDAGFSCPNKDGSRGTGGCIFCLNGSSSASGTLAEQYGEARRVAQRKWRISGFIPYLQANTNTYAPPDALRRVYEEAAALPGAVMLAVATRADCLCEDAVAELVRISKKLPVTVELGLQSTDDGTAERINRGHTFAEFVDGYRRLRAAGGRISVGFHIINGLPGETRETMIKTAADAAALSPDMMKIHLLHVLRDTPLAVLFERGEYVPMEKDEYVAVVCDQLELLPPECVIARLSGEAPEDVLVAPAWCRRKIAVMNDVDRELFRRGSWQGKDFSGTDPRREP